MFVVAFAVGFGVFVKKKMTELTSYTEVSKTLVAVWTPVEVW